MRTVSRIVKKGRLWSWVAELPVHRVLETARAEQLGRLLGRLLEGLWRA
jgi:hypothetical protein